MMLLAIIFIALEIGVFIACVKYAIQAVKMARKTAENGNIGATIVLWIFGLSMLLFPVFIVVSS